MFYDLCLVYYYICQRNGISGKLSSPSIWYPRFLFYICHHFFFPHWFPLKKKKKKKANKQTNGFQLHWSFMKSIWNVRLPSVPSLEVLYPPYGLGNVRRQADTEFRWLHEVLNNLQQALKVKWHGRRTMKYPSKVMMKSWSDAPYNPGQLEGT